ncbi:MAG: polyprenyl synthetase family protein [Chloroflexi bacterium]|nr:polyprenyl synthetase family protein [Chloroflexota bacterium]
MVNLSLLAPIEAELAEMEQRLLTIGEADFPWLGQLLRHILGSGGKRARPAITLLVGKLYRYDPALHIPMAVAVELLHTASLVHDDTVDKASLRRGRETVNALWGDEAAVLLGDYLFASSAEMVCSTGNVRVIQLFARTLRDLGDGELRELHRAFDWALGEKSYWERIERKTSSLFATAAQSGAILGGAPELAVQAFREYGRSLGTAFQVIDDILDFEGDQEEVGKPVGNDLRQGVITLPAILYLQRYAPGPGPFRRLGRPGLSGAPQGAEESALQEALAVVRASPAIQDAYEIAGQHGEQARRALAWAPAGPARHALEELVDYVIARRR